MQNDYYFFKLIVFVFILLGLNACSVSKRVHRKGWNVEWHRAYDGSKTVKTVETKQAITSVKQSYTDAEKIEAENTPPLAETVQIEKKNEEKRSIRNSSTQQEQTTMDFAKTKLPPSAKKKATQKKPVSLINNPFKENPILAGKIMVIIGLIFVFGLSIQGATKILIMLAWAMIIAGIIIWIRGHRKLKKESEPKVKSEKSKRFLKIGLILLIIGIALAFGTFGLFSILEAAAASTANVVTEVTTVTVGAVFGYILGFIAGIMIGIGLLLLIVGWMKD